MGNWEIGGGARRDGVLARTAIGPRSATTAAAPESVVLWHWQVDAGFAGWCMGHCALPVWTQVQATGSAASECP